MTPHSLYEKALRLHPELWYTVQLVERVHDDSVFPIKTRDELINVLLANDIGLKSESHLKLDGPTLSSADASNLFPLSYLPVAGRDDLLVKLYGAFMNMKTLFQLEASVRRMRQFNSKKGASNV